MNAPNAAYPDGFRRRRGLNWASIGFMYATFYMCRYNFRIATPGMKDELNFDIAQIAALWGWWSLAYGTGQLINGLLADRIGGKRCLLFGAVGTICISLMIGLSPMVNSYFPLAVLMMVNAYFQSFGAPGFVKINAAWFRKSERGTFAGIFGGMINLGQIAIYRLGPWILAGLAFKEGVPGMIEPGNWKLLFIIPPIFTMAASIFLFFAVKETPDAAGYPGLIKDEHDDSAGVRTPIAIVFKTIFTNPFVWFYAVAYACTGAVRHSSDQLGNLFFEDMLGFDMKIDPPTLAKWTLILIPFVAFLGSLCSGVISDRVFKGKRAPVSMGLYFIMAVVLAASAYLVFTESISAAGSGVLIGCLVLLLISITVNSTHSLVGAAAPMDIGGKKMAGFASGVIDSFQYYGSAFALYITGTTMARYEDASGTVSNQGWLYWFCIMGAFSLIGGVAMLLLNRKQKRLAAEGKFSA